MSNTPIIDEVDVIDRNSNFVNESFDLDRMDSFVKGLGVSFKHYKAMPSPIGQKDRGDYHRSDGVDTITSNGMIYVCSGEFNGVITNSKRDRIQGEAGVLDPSDSFMVLPRFYNPEGTTDGKRIYLSLGDRIYVADPDADVLVSNMQKMDYTPNVDGIPMFPIVEMELDIIDSRNISYKEEVDYCITRDGNIRWISGGRNPGIDPDTQKGRVYSIRYLYKAYHYVTKLLNEVRITNVTTDGVRSPERMPYHIVITREFAFRNQNNGDKENQLKPKDPLRTVKPPTESMNPDKNVIQVNMDNFDDGQEQS